MSTLNMSRGTVAFAGGLMAAVALMAPVAAIQGVPSGACRITGKATSGTTPLPGVAVTIKSGGAAKGATSTDVDGGFAVNVTPGQYTLVAELTGFVPVERPLVVGDGACAQTVDFTLTLAPRTAVAA